MMRSQLVHPGGWQSISDGSVPFKNLYLPAGSGALIIRKHPHGQPSRIPLRGLTDGPRIDINQAP